MRALSCLLALAFGLAAAAPAYALSVQFDEMGFARAINEARVHDVDGRILGAVVPHFLPVMGFAASLLKTVAAGDAEIETVILFGPNHSDEGPAIILTGYGWHTPFGAMEPDLDAVAAIAAVLPNIRINDGLFYLEYDHSLSIIVPFIKHYLPQAQIVSIMFNRAVSLSELATLADIIHDLSRTKNILMLASIDFSHYMDINETPQRDAFTDNVIRSSDFNTLKNLCSAHLDSPEAMILLMKYAQHFNHELLHLDGVIHPESVRAPHIGYSFHVYAFVD